jgi:hypothetical protein
MVDGIGRDLAIIQISTEIKEFQSHSKTTTTM